MLGLQAAKVLAGGRQDMQERSDVYVWPLELVWLFDIEGDDQRFQLVGPLTEVTSFYFLAINSFRSP